jgi:hypothetical protein
MSGDLTTEQLEDLRATAQWHRRQGYGTLNCDIPTVLALLDQAQREAELLEALSALLRAATEGQKELEALLQGHALSNLTHSAIAGLHVARVAALAAAPKETA